VVVVDGDPLDTDMVDGGPDVVMANSIQPVSHDSSRNSVFSLSSRELHPKVTGSLDLLD